MDQNKVTEFLGRAVSDLGATEAAGSVVIGHRLGLYRALAEGPATPEEFAERTRCHPRYFTEWLSGQAAGGYVGYDAATGRFSQVVGLVLRGVEWCIWASHVVPRHAGGPRRATRRSPRSRCGVTVVGRAGTLELGLLGFELRELCGNLFQHHGALGDDVAQFRAHCLSPPG
ncbi:hypothetical protein ACIBO2_24900 [Nonomuraea sp. NPDC050022]|uniref:hypothetical protein n=1 Tax=Nonomuraea sp. NPDC050022 TaxID=3364358 RepID=UPI0037BC91E1